MRKESIFFILLLPLCLSAQGNLVFNPGFDMTPWDTGWVKDTATDTSGSDNGSASTNTNFAVDTGHSLPNCCYFNASTHVTVHPDNGNALVYASAEISQMFPKVINCTCKIYVKYDIIAETAYGTGIDSCKVSLCINRKWLSVWAVACSSHLWVEEDKDTNVWIEISNFTGASDAVNGIKLRVNSYSDASSPCIYNDIDGIGQSLFWIDDVYISGTKVGVEENVGQGFSLAKKLEAYPNPFTQKTVIRYLLNESRHGGNTIDDLRLTIYDLSGKLVKSFCVNPLPNQCLSVFWDGTDNTGKKLPEGIYFLRTINQGENINLKLMLMR